MGLSERLRSETQLVRLVLDSEPLLRHEVGGTTTASWDLTSDPSGGPRVLLHLSDPFKGECSAVFEPEEFHRSEHLTRRFAGLKEALGRVAVWRTQLHELFETVRSGCCSLAPELRITEQARRIQEPRTGEYEIPVLRLDAREGTAEIVPIGTWVPGTDGRVDVVGSEQKHTLIYSKREGGWLWVDAGKQVVFRPLTTGLVVRLIWDCLR